MGANNSKIRSFFTKKCYGTRQKDINYKKSDYNIDIDDYNVPLCNQQKNIYYNTDADVFIDEYLKFGNNVGLKDEFTEFTVSSFHS